jgi:hypothetical protein
MFAKVAFFVAKAIVGMTLRAILASFGVDADIAAWISGGGRES